MGETRDQEEQRDVKHIHKGLLTEPAGRAEMKTEESRKSPRFFCLFVF